jgi:hypothetical protein
MPARVVHLAGECEFRWRHARRSAAFTSSRSRRSQSRQSPLTNGDTLKLGQSAEDVEDQVAARRRCVDVFLQAVEANVAAPEPLVHPEYPALSRARLAWIQQNYMRADTITNANIRLSTHTPGFR